VSDVKQQMVVWSIPTTIAWAIGGTCVALLNLLFGSGGTWLDPVLPLLVLALIIWIVRRQPVPVLSDTVTENK
ncbi:MAG: hypothetical protein ACRDC6_21295, partial [Shewanella sp.]